MEKKLKSWQGWLLFGGTMVVVFCFGYDRCFRERETCGGL